MTKPMTDEQIMRWKETGEGFHTDEIAEELLRLREENERQDKTISALHKQTTLRGKEIRRLRDRVKELEADLNKSEDSASLSCI